MGDEATDERRPVAEALAGHGTYPFGEGWTPLEAFVLVKRVDEAGGTAWSFRTTHPLNLEELLGASTIQAETLERKPVRTWEDEDPDYQD